VTAGRLSPGAAFDETVEHLEVALGGSFRRDLVAELARAADSRGALTRLRDGMRAHRWKAGGRVLDLGALARELDRRTRADGFHALHDWDGVAASVNPDIIPVDVLGVAMDSRGAEPPEPNGLAILIDYYFLYLLALLSLRVWDAGSADAGLDRLSALLDRLQGPDGSGQRFADDAETLMLIATSHYEADERCYPTLLERVRGLSARHQTAVAIGHAASMGCHLRFGFEATYARSLDAMRDDNIADYPWLSYALVTLMREYARLVAAGDDSDRRAPVVEAMLNGLTPDPDAFVGEASIHVPSSEAERREFRGSFDAHRRQLVDELEAHRPATSAYSPLSLRFNFCQNALKGMVLDAVLWNEPSAVSLNDMLSGRVRGTRDDAARQAVARTLMRYARSNPHRIRGQLLPVIVYDPSAGRRAFLTTLRAARGRDTS